MFFQLYTAIHHFIHKLTTAAHIIMINTNRRGLCILRQHPHLMVSHGYLQVTVSPVNYLTVLAFEQGIQRQLVRGLRTVRQPLGCRRCAHRRRRARHRRIGPGERACAEGVNFGTSGARPAVVGINKVFNERKRSAIEPGKRTSRKALNHRSIRGGGR